MQNPALDRSRSLSDTQGGAARLRRLALPWADLLHAFSVRNLQNRNFKTGAAGCYDRELVEPYKCSQLDIERGGECAEFP